MELAQVPSKGRFMFEGTGGILCYNVQWNVCIKTIIEAKVVLFLSWS